MATENTKSDKPDEETPLPEKNKNPKRVEQGRRLAEWNRQNKVKIKALAEKPVVVQEPTLVEKPTPTKKSVPENYLILGGVIIAGGIVIGALYFIKRGAEVSSPEFSTPKESSPAPKVSLPDPEPQSDLFDMA